MAEKYEMPWRPNFEAVATTAWISSIGVAWAIQHASGLPSGPFWALSATATAVAGLRGASALRLWRRRRRLSGKKLWFMPLDELMREFKKARNKGIFVGRGFEWEPRHAQLAYDIAKRDKLTRLPAARAQRGSAWIHGVGSDGERKIYLPVEDMKGHLLLLGTTGAGKTRLLDLLISQAIMRDEAVIILDPKGDKELRDVAERACAKMGKPDRFVLFHPAFPYQSVRLDPLANFSRLTELASRIAALIPSETGADPFKAFGQSALNNLSQGLVLINQRPQLTTLRSLLEGGTDKLVVKATEAYLDRHMEDWRNAISKQYMTLTETKKAGAICQFYWDRIPAEKKNPDLEGLLSMYMHNRDHFVKMIASLLPVLNQLTSGEIGKLLSPNALDPDDTRPIMDTARLITDAKVTYIGLDSLSDAMVGASIGSIILADLAAVAGARYNYGGDTLAPVNVFVDEAAEVVNAPFLQVLNKGRGALFRLTVATQTIADFVSRMGGEAPADQLLGNLNNVVALRLLDERTKEFFARKLPMTTYRHIMETMANSTDAGLVHSGNVGARLMEAEGELFPPALLGNLPDLEFLANFSGGRVVKGRLPILGASS